jgi:hypothetical protein
VFPLLANSQSLVLLPQILLERNQKLAFLSLMKLMKLDLSLMVKLVLSKSVIFLEIQVYKLLEMKLKIILIIQNLIQKEMLFKA